MQMDFVESSVLRFLDLSGVSVLFADSDSQAAYIIARLAEVRHNIFVCSSALRVKRDMQEQRKNGTGLDLDLGFVAENEKHLQFLLALPEVSEDLISLRNSPLTQSQVNFVQAYKLLTKYKNMVDLAKWYRFPRLTTPIRQVASTSSPPLSSRTHFEQHIPKAAAQSLYDSLHMEIASSPIPVSDPKDSGVLVKPPPSPPPTTIPTVRPGGLTAPKPPRFSLPACFVTNHSS